VAEGFAQRGQFHGAAVDLCCRVAHLLGQLRGLGLQGLLELCARLRQHLCGRAHQGFNAAALFTCRLVQGLDQPLQLGGQAGAFFQGQVVAFRQA